MLCVCEYTWLTQGSRFPEISGLMWHKGAAPHHQRAITSPPNLCATALLAVLRFIPSSRRARVCVRPG